MIVLFEIEGGHETTVKMALRTVLLGTDVWDRISPEPVLFPTEGAWEFGAESPPGWDLELSTEFEGKVATLWAFSKMDSVKAGERGQGSFIPDTYAIPPLSTIEWHVLEVIQ
ncbi:hypothetical protein ABT237_37130 [Streptomyces sp. NPDC001581]|uniref:hypothetical protein n=1 Tax=Streptomyces sp. NPDC001581 TaxID=3154386 RepID=UPI0033230E29